MTRYRGLMSQRTVGCDKMWIPTWPSLKAIFISSLYRSLGLSSEHLGWAYAVHSKCYQPVDNCCGLMTQSRPIRGDIGLPNFCATDEGNNAENLTTTRA